MLQTKTNDIPKTCDSRGHRLAKPFHQVSKKSNNKKEKERSPLTMCQISIQPNYWSAASGACICFTVYTCRHFSFVDSWPFNIIVKMIFFLHKHVVGQKYKPIFRFLALDVVAFSLRGFSFKNQTFKLPLGFCDRRYTVHLETGFTFHTFQISKIVQLRWKKKKNRVVMRSICGYIFFHDAMV